MNTWLEGRIGCEYYHDESGKIVGKIIRSSIGDETFYAEVLNDRIGEYINRALARAAVENACIERPPLELDTGLFDLKFDYTIPSPACESEYDYPPQEPYSEMTYTIALSEEEEKPKKKKKR